MPELENLPGGDLVRAGLEDLRENRLSVDALLVLVGATRLRIAGLDVPRVELAGLPEHRLYAELVASGIPDPYSAYNALIRRLVSFETALEQLGELQVPR